MERSFLNTGRFTGTANSILDQTEVQRELTNVLVQKLSHAAGTDLRIAEPFLASVQSSDAPGPGTFNTPWSQLSPGRQAAVIVAVEAAADNLCG